MTTYVFPWFSRSSRASADIHYLLQIYMLSSINHHIAILHLRVHRRYLEVMTTGQSDFPPESDTPEQAWHELRLRRTRWYDLLNGEDRVEVFKGIWSIFHYMLRRT